MSTLFEVIKRPIVTEKSMKLAEDFRRYVFQVSLNSNKREIREAVQQLFKVKVLKVQTLIMPGKVKRTARAEAKRPNWKKAMVTIAEGQTIDIFQKK